MKYYVSEIKYRINELLLSIDEASGVVFNKIQQDGFAILKDFVSPEQCRMFCKAIDEQISKPYAWKDQNESDFRIHGIERVDNLFKDLFHTPLLNDVYKKYIDKQELHAFIMANKVCFKKQNLGSGGGWHRDMINRRQLKFILYFNDVNEKNGCFEYLPGTHKVLEKWRINNSLGLRKSEVRYENNGIERLIKNGCASVSLTGLAGTLIIADTSGIHRGRPLIEGVRYAATQYMSDVKFPSHIMKLLPNKISNNK